MRFALAHSKFYPFPPLPPPTNVGSRMCIMATTRFHIFLYAISARQPTLQGGGRGGERMRLCIYQKFPLYRVKRQFPILSQNNYSMIVGLFHRVILGLGGGEGGKGTGQHQLNLLEFKAERGLAILSNSAV